MVDKHPWDDLKTDIPQLGTVPEAPGDYPELPDAAPATDLPEGDAETDEDMS